MNKKVFIIDWLIFINLCVYFILLFFTKGEGLRNILIFSSIALWLINLKHIDLTLLKDKITFLSAIFIFAILVSIFFSYNPLFSVKELQSEPLKSLVLFPVAITTFSNLKRVKNLPYISLVVLLVIISIGTYSFLVQKSLIFTALTPFLHAHPNKFVFYTNFYLAFVMSLIFSEIKQKKLIKIIALIAFLLNILSLFLNTSREGIAGFIGICGIWLFYLYKKGYNVKKPLLIGLVIILLFASISWSLSPYVRERVKSTPEHLKTFNLRIPTWIKGLEAWVESPITGWGWGDRFFQDVSLYKSINKTPPEYSPHNMFLRILFHTGLIGFIPFILLIFYSIYDFFKNALITHGYKSLILISITSCLFGNYVIHSFFSDSPRIHWLYFLIGLGIAIKKISDENSNS